MKFCDEFIDLLADPAWVGKYIGEGNPNASILIVGQESAIDQYPKDDDKNSSWLLSLFNKNHSLWQKNQQCITDSGNLFIEDWTKQTELRLEKYNPYDPFCGQAFSLRHNVVGTNKTWYNYQKILNSAALESRSIDYAEKYTKLSVFRNCFVTELNDYCIPNHKKETLLRYSQEIGENIHQVIEQHIGARYDLICEHDHGFFKKFDVVILACGKKYVEKLNTNRMFGSAHIIPMSQAARLNDYELSEIGRKVGRFLL